MSQGQRLTLGQSRDFAGILQPKYSQSATAQPQDQPRAQPPRALTRASMERRTVRSPPPVLSLMIISGSYGWPSMQPFSSTKSPPYVLGMLLLKPWPAPQTAQQKKG